jgi:spore maturation protein CgeB
MRGGPVRHEAALNDLLDHDDIFARFFAGEPRAPVYTKCISSRHFDAIGTGTCQILLRGRYNDILAPDEHYLPLDDDFANLDEVVDRFRDPAERERITSTALEFALDNHTYAHRVRQVSRLLFASIPAPGDLDAAVSV